MNELDSLYFSLIIPVFNELNNLDILYNNIITSLSAYDDKYEIIFIDDGSNDGSYEKLSGFALEDVKVKLIKFRRNFGQTAAISAGISHSSGKIIVFIDSDMQNDPSDIPMLLDKIDEGFDVVCGWRKDRKDKLFLRKIPSFLANYIIRKVSRVKIHDIGCSLKAFRCEIIKEISLYGELHRFLPVLASRIGADIIEVPVKHHPRINGKSKYGLNRTFKVLLDLVTVQFLGAYSTKPIYLFGGLSLLFLFFSLISGLSVILMKIFSGTDITGNPLFLITILCVLVTVFLLLMGIQSEVLTRIYHQQDKNKQYFIKETKNI
jgi:glycosyltransferase involved in cell wall biosynthesis